MTNEEAMKLLKPCPRCGDKSPVLYTLFGDKFIVHCGKYMCNRDYAYMAPTREECIEEWNNLPREADNE